MFLSPSLFTIPVNHAMDQIIVIIVFPLIGVKPYECILWAWVRSNGVFGVVATILGVKIDMKAMKQQRLCGYHQLQCYV